MIKGLFISEDGEVQILGDVKTLQAIIQIVLKLPDELQRMQLGLVAAQLTDEELQQIRAMRSNTGKTEKLEP